MKTPDQSPPSGPSSPESGKLPGRWAKLAPRKRIALIAALLSTLVLVSVATLGLRSHVQNNPGFCLGACHTETAQALANAPPVHKDMPCAACHDMQFSQNAWLYVLQSVQGPSANPKHAVATAALCESCHATGQGSRLQVSTSVGHQSHASKADLPCSACHGGKTHNFTADKNGCARCHADTKMFEAGMASLSCASCHNFLAPSAKGGAAPSTQCRSCHGGKQDASIVPSAGAKTPAREVSHAMIHGSIFACSVCHQPHESDLEKRRTGRDCSRCHARAPVSDKAISNPAHSACGTCHRVHSARSELSSACASCHAEAKAETLQHTPAGKHPSCGSCHSAHDFIADRSACATCHRDQSPVANVARLAAHADCGNCHAPHRPAAEREACATCHERYRGHGHQHCVTCHDPHKDKTSTKSCTSCHSKESTAVLAGKGAHKGGCQTCHAPHAAGSVTARCASCHGQQSSAVAAAGNTAHGQCASCHRPHTFLASSGGDACKSCHKISTQGAHKGECRQCHTTHGSPRVGSTACAQCHSDIPRAKRGKHAECRSCHASHQAASGGSLRCSQCHASQQAGAQSWQPTQHKSCVSCHKPHDPSSAVSCTQCHAKQATTTGSKKHTCRTCHDPHQAPGGWWNRCSSCHKSEASAVKSRGTTHATCQSCHKPHRLSKPGCTTCHNAMSRLGAHRESGHATCANCHDTHAKNTVGRAKCLSCHKDKTAHNPTARFCTGCHLFR